MWIGGLRGKRVPFKSGRVFFNGWSMVGNLEMGVRWEFERSLHPLAFYDKTTLGWCICYSIISSNRMNMINGETKSYYSLYCAGVLLFEVHIYSRILDVYVRNVQFLKVCL